MFENTPEECEDDNETWRLGSASGEARQARWRRIYSILRQSDENDEAPLASEKVHY